MKKEIKEIMIRFGKTDIFDCGTAFLIFRDEKTELLWSPKPKTFTPFGLPWYHSTVRQLEPHIQPYLHSDTLKRRRLSIFEEKYYLITKPSKN